MADMVRVSDSLGMEFVAATVHVSTYNLAPLRISVDNFVPLAFGRSDVTDDMVRSPFRLEYCFVPDFHDSHFVPSFFACEAVRPNSVVRPVELPRTYASAEVTLMAKSALPSESVSEPLVVPTSAMIFSVVDDELECATNTTWALVCWAIACGSGLEYRACRDDVGTGHDAEGR